MDQVVRKATLNHAMKMRQLNSFSAGKAVCKRGLATPIFQKRANIYRSQVVWKTPKDLKQQFLKGRGVEFF